VKAQQARLSKITQSRCEKKFNYFLNMVRFFNYSIDSTAEEQKGKGYVWWAFRWMDGNVGFG